MDNEQRLTLTMTMKLHVIMHMYVQHHDLHWLNVSDHITKFTVHLHQQVSTQPDSNNICPNATAGRTSSPGHQHLCSAHHGQLDVRSY